MIRADAIVMLRLDTTGRLTAQLRDAAGVNVTLLEDVSGGGRPPADFHRRLIRKVAELGDSSGAQLVGTQCEDGAWRYQRIALTAQRAPPTGGRQALLDVLAAHRDWPGGCQGPSHRRCAAGP